MSSMFHHFIYIAAGAMTIRQRPNSSVNQFVSTQLGDGVKRPPFKKTTPTKRPPIQKDHLAKRPPIPNENFYEKGVPG